MNISFISININGLRDADKRRGFLQWLSYLAPTVVCLEGTHCLSSSELLSWFSSHSYLCSGFFGFNHSCGVPVLYRSVLSCRLVVGEFDGRFVLVEFGLRDFVYRVGSVYDAFFGLVQDCVDPSVPTLLSGDFNTVFDRVLDRRGSCPFDVSRESSSLFVDCCMVDILHTLHPNCSCFSVLWSHVLIIFVVSMYGFLLCLLLRYYRVLFLTTESSLLLFPFPPSSQQALACGS